LGYALGAEVTGLDLASPLDDATVAEIRELWLENPVLVFPGARLEPQQLVDFSRRFGAVDDNRKLPHYRHPGFDDIMVISNKAVAGKPSETRYNGRNWHSDLTYTDHPATGTLLLCKEKPDVGGDTMFANMYLAYEALSPGMKALLEPLWAVHDITKVEGFERRDPAQVAEMKRLNPPIAHPIVKRHPETGRSSLFLGERVRNILGMTEAESRPLVDFLNGHAVRDGFVYRHRWSEDDLVLWDNRCTMHFAVGDFDQSQPRHMLRCSLLGVKSGRVVVDEASAALPSLEQSVASVS
jgi:taurine dioxygenase